MLCRDGTGTGRFEGATGMLSFPRSPRWTHPQTFPRLKGMAPSPSKARLGTAPQELNRCPGLLCRHVHRTASGQGLRQRKLSGSSRQFCAP